MIVSPYLKKFTTQGGTLYVFPSVSKDLSRTLISNDYEFKFSHFACLNLPEIKQGKYDATKDKGFYISTFMDPNSIPSSWDSGIMCDMITLNLQNYVMNFETAILNGMGDNDEYDNEILTSVSEKVFWNWMQKVGAIKFNEEGTMEEASSLSSRTVQYIGNLDVMNTVEIGGDSYNELYIHIPSTVGASTNVYFRLGAQTDNKNYLNKNYVISGYETNLIGRSDEGTSPEYYGGLSTIPFYDIDNQGNIYTGDDGHTIDFRDTSYADGYGISTMNGESYEDFEFNAVLIYYDILEKTNDVNVRRISTNLYGILFLDQVKDENQGNDFDGYFQRYPKKRETVYGNGNSYALKVDFKIDTLGDERYEYDDSIVKIYSANDVVAMGLYEKALIQLQKCVDFFYTQKNEIVKLTERVEALENIVVGIDTISSLKDQVSRLYNLYEANSVVDTSSLLSLIDSNTKKLENIMNGGKDIKLQFDTDVLQPGEGIGLIKQDNKVIINSEQRYAMNTVINKSDNTEINSNNKLNTSNPVPCEIKLKPGENFAVINIDDTGDSTSNLYIYIDDSDCNWEAGQSLKIYFYGDYGSMRFGDNPGIGVVIEPKQGADSLTIEGSEFDGNNLIELVCVEKGIDLVTSDKFIYLINK